ncbi:dsRBD fold-containing protein [Streptomyces sp. NPDC002763]|uniref:dsRBD fold-containing protein n=1 Tax=Streptomyces sp. NPDC002763 TaxID=3154427 RepID=UPI0033219277
MKLAPEIGDEPAAGRAMDDLARQLSDDLARQLSDDWPSPLKQSERHRRHHRRHAGVPRSGGGTRPALCGVPRGRVETAPL